VPALGSAGVVAAVVAVLPFLMSTYHTFLGAQVGIFVIAVLGLNILTGYTGQISIGHGAFMAVGAYTAAILSRDHNTNIVLGMLAAFAVSFAAGLLVGLPALRLEGAYLALATFALAISVPQFPLHWSKYLGGSLGVQARSEPTKLLGFTFPSAGSVGNDWFYGLAWAAAAILFVLAWLILRGRLGRAFRAVRDSETAAVASGVETGLYKTLGFGISAAFCGVAGALLVMVSGSASYGTFGVVLSLELLIGAAVAGLGSLWGVLVGGAFVALLPTISTSLPYLPKDHGRDVIYGVLVILVMLVLPGGFAGLLARVRSLVARA
jgi:branched-chain amino acid transport system permease protein